jgi:hypothetical protein
MNDNLLLVKFDYSIAAKRHTGEGHLISSTENSAIIFESSRAGQGEAKFHTIKSEHKIHSIEPNKSDKKLKLSDHLFFNITPDSVHKLIKNKAIIQLKLQSNSPFSYIKENSPQSGSSANLEHVFNPVISFLPDSAANDLENRMQLLDYDLQRAKSEKSNLSQSRYRLHARIDSLTVSIAKMDLYTREKEVPHLAKLKTELEQLDQQISQMNQANNSGKISLQLQQLKKEKEERKKILVSGYIQIASL